MIPSRLIPMLFADILGLAGVGVVVVPGIPTTQTLSCLVRPTQSVPCLGRPTQSAPCLIRPEQTLELLA